MSSHSFCLTAGQAEATIYVSHDKHRTGSLHYTIGGRHVMTTLGNLIRDCRGDFLGTTDSVIDAALFAASHAGYSTNVSIVGPLH